MREYETFFAVRADQGDALIKKVVETVETSIKNFGGDIIKVDDLGKKRFSFHVKKQSKGRYFVIDYAGTAAIPAEVERLLRYQEDILLYQTHRLKDVADLEARKVEARKTVRTPRFDTEGTVDAIEPEPENAAKDESADAEEQAAIEN